MPDIAAIPAELRAQLQRLSLPELMLALAGQPIQNTKDPSKLLSRKAAAVYLGLGESTLRKLLQEGKGPRQRRLGGRIIRFRVSDLIEWLESTNEIGGQGNEKAIKRRKR
jgi:excisionase family DNA binding protein